MYFATEQDVKRYLKNKPSVTNLMIVGAPFEEFEMPEQLERAYFINCHNLRSIGTELHSNFRFLDLYNSGVVVLPRMPETAHVRARYCRALLGSPDELHPERTQFESCRNLLGRPVRHTDLKEIQ